MNYFKITLEYSGLNYYGFQDQKHLTTVQGELNSKLKNILGDNFSTFGASRTDTGVHAYHQVVKLTTERNIQFDLKADLNSLLPKDILIKKFEQVDGAFHPTSYYKTKEYRYFFTNHKILKLRSPFIANISNNLSLEKIEDCLPSLIGQNNFQNFYSMGSNVRSTQREIYSATLTSINPHDLFLDNPIFKIDQNITHCYQFKITANGFLKQMNRHLMSALWSVGSGKIGRDEFDDLLLREKTNKQNWKVAPPNGLFLFDLR